MERHRAAALIPAIRHISRSAVPLPGQRRSQSFIRDSDAERKAAAAAAAGNEALKVVHSHNVQPNFPVQP